MFKRPKDNSETQPTRTPPVKKPTPPKPTLPGPTQRSGNSAKKKEACSTQNNAIAPMTSVSTLAAGSLVTAQPIQQHNDAVPNRQLPRQSSASNKKPSLQLSKIQTIIHISPSGHSTIPKSEPFNVPVKFPHHKDLQRAHNNKFENDWLKWKTSLLETGSKSPKIRHIESPHYNHNVAKRIKGTSCVTAQQKEPTTKTPYYRQVGRKAPRPIHPLWFPCMRSQRRRTAQSIHRDV
jgi:hypothetical protein